MSVRDKQSYAIDSYSCWYISPVVLHKYDMSTSIGLPKLRIGGKQSHDGAHVDLYHPAMQVDDDMIVIPLGEPNRKV